MRKSKTGQLLLQIKERLQKITLLNQLSNSIIQTVEILRLRHPRIRGLYTGCVKSIFDDFESMFREIEGNTASRVNLQTAQKYRERPEPIKPTIQQLWQKLDAHEALNHGVRADAQEVLTEAEKHAISGIEETRR